MHSAGSVLCKTGLVANCECCYCIVYLDFTVVPNIFVKTKSKPVKLFPGSPDIIRRGNGTYETHIDSTSEVSNMEYLFSLMFTFFILILKWKQARGPNPSKEEEEKLRCSQHLFTNSVHVSHHRPFPPLIIVH
jgi:hypothetical protein